MPSEQIYEKDLGPDKDPEESRKPDGKLITQPYDLVVSSLLAQIEDGTIHLRNISERPKFQRRYVWNDRLASRLIESMLLNVPIPPCFLAQNQDFELDVIDGQQRILSIYRFVDNQFRLSGLEVLTELNGLQFFQLPSNQSRRIMTYTLRCVIVTNDSDPEIRFEVFERLNTSTVPLNAQELRNSISRGSLIDLVSDLAEDPLWLKILNRDRPDKRMRGEELILRFYGFYIHGVESYSTPLKLWLNYVADHGRNYDPEFTEKLALVWRDTLDKCLLVFSPEECFRRLPVTSRQVINRALMDLTMWSISGVPIKDVKRASAEFYQRYLDLLQDGEFQDLITRSVDHKSRTLRRFDIWSDKVANVLF